MAGDIMVKCVCWNVLNVVLSGLATVFFVF